MTNGSRLLGLRVAVDVQHLYRDGEHLMDRGSVFTLPDRTHVTEADLTLVYGAALASWLKSKGATVVVNRPEANSLVGPYARRNLEAVSTWNVHAYLACHVNAGGGSYANFEYMSQTPGGGLALAIGREFSAEFGTIVPIAKETPLYHGQRGAVCIQEVPSGVICEPFFGDNRAHQVLFSAPELKHVGETIGEGVARWWERKRA